MNTRARQRPRRVRAHRRALRRPTLIHERDRDASVTSKNQVRGARFGEESRDPNAHLEIGRRAGRFRPRRAGIERAAQP